MSKYTTEVRYICETAAGLTESKGFNDVNTIITTAAPNVFNFTWPIFDENYRLPLEVKILRHFYTREIGEETVGLWKLRLQDKLNVIMPYYNKLYESELIKFNPMWDVDVHREHEGSGITDDERKRNENVSDDRIREYHESFIGNREYDETNNDNVTDSRTRSEAGTSRNTINSETSGNEKVDNIKSDVRNEEQTNNGTGSNTTNGAVGKDEWNLYSDTPQGGIQGIVRASDGESTVYDSGGNAIGTADVAENAYLTNARHIIGNETTTNMVTATTNNNTNKVNGSNETVESGNRDNTVSEERTDAGISNNYSDESGVRIGDSNKEGNVQSIENRNNSSIDSAVTGRDTNEKGTITNVNEYVQHIYGKQSGVSFSKLLNEFRQTFINIDEMILDELRPLFLNLW